MVREMPFCVYAQFLLPKSTKWILSCWAIYPHQRLRTYIRVLMDGAHNWILPYVSDALLSRHLTPLVIFDWGHTPFARPTGGTFI